jgi:hypothetical protein
MRNSMNAAPVTASKRSASRGVSLGTRAVGAFSVWIDHTRKQLFSTDWENQVQRCIQGILRRAQFFRRFALYGRRG